MFRLTLLSTLLCAILAHMTITLRGFTIRSHKSSADKYTDQYQNVWAEAGQIPTEWDEVKQDPEVERAQLYKSSQRRVRADKRRYLDTK